MTLTQEQINLIELAIIKQVPPEDAEFMENVQKNSTKDSSSHKPPLSEISKYFIEKYGMEFGMLLFAAITGGRRQYNKTKKAIEEQRAADRLNRVS